ncbi:GH36-type glycosyl hydrolase domain-containing protein [Fonticella tunisiensis]|uniref:Cyclic beta-1,2-glucan synthetase n=1 Tax=Fonticella tunisiensis TaxID=1096341 RepID=A0A4R7KRE1_9CLOT|nr:glucoamylase family protein [Fonticella tunisiensis]TDT61306.1 cyclic beta-1,2-glucan synthetase [Fonticella tunisiensis]
MILNSHELYLHGKNIAKDHIVSKQGEYNKLILNRLDNNFIRISRVYRFLKDRAKNNKSLCPASEWLLDNYYIIEEQVKWIMANCSRRFLKKLRTIQSGSLKGYPRTFAICLELINHTDGKLDKKQIIEFIKAYQTIEPLSMAELWSISTMLRIALVEKIADICQVISDIHKEWSNVERFKGKDHNEIFNEIKKTFTSMDSINYAYIERLSRFIKSLEVNEEELFRYIDDRLHEFNTSMEEVIKHEHNEQAALKISIGNCITSLRLISALDFNEIFESLSHVEGILRKDPSGYYMEQDFESRNYYRRQVEKIAERYKVSEIQVARTALDCTLKYEDISKASSHVGYYLAGKGRTYLIRDIEKNPSGLKKNVLAVYVLPVAIITAILSLGLALYSYTSAVKAPLLIAALTLIIALIPSSEIAVTITNWIITHLKTPDFIPKLELRNGIPEECTTIIIVPTILPNVKRVIELIRNLEVTYMANNEDNIYFALVGDLKDSGSEFNDEDEDILNTARDMIEELNRKYGDNKFYFLCRRRIYNDRQGRWMGWDRKRGAVLEFNRLIKGDKNTTFSTITGNIENLKRAKYVITLDADTILPIGRARSLIGAISHPLNKAVFDDKKGIVIEGYGLIQPRIGINIVSTNKSLFTRIFAGSGGIDPYTAAVSDVYQDLFHEGIFTGKGIYDIDIFIKALDEAIPENTLLSHDLIEGSYLRTGLATDIELIDGYPEKYSSYIMRLHRWVRGDWQTIRWLFPYIKNRYGKRIKNPISLLSRWKLFDNLRRSLVSTSLMLVIISGILFLPGTPSLWLSFAVLTVFLPILLNLADYLALKYYNCPGIRVNGDLIYGFKAAFYQCLLNFIFLPYHSYIMMDAALKSLYRVFVSKRNLLEWVTAAEVEKNMSNDFKGYINRMYPVLIESAVLYAVAFVFRRENLIAIIPLLIVWALSPAVAYYISQPAAEPKIELSDEDNEFLRRISRKTWNFYEEFANEENNYLPVDNYQEEPVERVAHRTSPTNIGFLLMAILSARDLGYITTSEMLEKLDKTIGTIERMEKWNGHLYNWYDTRTLEVLMPKFISTVDSGNLMGYYITLKEGLKEHHEKLLHKNNADDDVEKVQNQISLIDSLIFRIEKLIADMKFESLYDKKRELFSIGYDVSNDKLINSYYDLLASEARITSYLAIAKREVSPSHWSRLGRSLVDIDGYRSLVSWTGTMFEYLMPPIIMRTYKNTLLGETYSTVINAQIKYGRSRKVPWGTSESGYHGFDHILNYQYKAFGVPDLGLKRGLVKDMVISPYSTILALPFSPKDALLNLHKLTEYNLEGKYGFYESVDFTPERMPRSQKYAVVKSFMAHHQGMIITALNNYFNNNILVKRFHSDPAVRAGEFLLQERIPVRAIITKEIKEDVVPFKTEEYEGFNYVRELGLPESPIPVCHLLSNGTYSIMVSNFGYSYSKLGDIMVTRWREDLSSKKYGTFIYLRDVNSNKVWSSTIEPVNAIPDRYKVIFSSDKAKFERIDGSIETHMEVCVSPEDNCEVRKLTIFNHGSEDATIECTSYLEPVLSPHMADIAHPAFNNLFVRTEALRDFSSIIASRRPREEGKKTLWAFHTLSADVESIGDLDFETDRYKFIGRGQNLKDPRGMSHPLTDTVGAVLDPIFSIRKKVKIAPGKSSVLYYTTGAAENRNSIIELCKKYSDPLNAERSFELAYLRGNIDNSYFNFKESDAKIFNSLISHILFISPVKKRYEEYIMRNRKGQPGLWAYGISGDLPIVLVTISKAESIEGVKTMLRAHEYWRSRGLKVDLVILNQDESDYFEPLLNLIRDLVSAGHGRELIDRAGGIFVRNAALMPEEDRILLYSASRIIINADEGSIKKQLTYFEAKEAQNILKASKIPCHYPDNLMYSPLLYYNGYGGFDNDNKEYTIILKDNIFTPAPWINVISNKNFGFTVTDTGGGFTWSENSRENKLTPWSNDPVSDPPGEIIYIRDDETGEIWTITPLPVREKEGYVISHGLGYSRFLHSSHGIEQQLTVFVTRDEPVKLSLVKLKNVSGTERRLSLYYYIRPVLGVTDQITQQHIITQFDENLGAFIVQNSYNSDFPGRIAFISSSLEVKSFTGNRLEFVGNAGDFKSPKALGYEGLSKQYGTGFDPCCVIQTSLSIKEDDEQELVFMLGQVKSMDNLTQLIMKYKDLTKCKAALEEAKGVWDELLNRLQIATPDDRFNIIMNTWLLYQTLSCRIWARSAFYQSGGAYGFRDQLQDVMSLLNIYPEIAKNQIILHCAHQFVEGDVQHWWHPGAGEKGIRTKFSDDLLWLPYVTAEYVEKTGDTDILYLEVPYLEDAPLGEKEDERYGVPKVSEQKSTVYEHCIRALERGLKFGEHGIPLMGSGDWNDGMNTVGNKGRGESIWLGWFICHTLKKFIPLCKIANDKEKAERYEEIVQYIADSIEKNAWDGEWYLRAYFDDGKPLGSSINSECKIDSIAQSWAVISGAGNHKRAEKAMNSVENYLVMEDEGLIKLFTPPFDKGDLSPGYIKGYVPGVRENGGQYTHAATWVVYAFARMGYGNKAYSLFSLINPINHTMTDLDCARYKVEPYVMAADVYAVEPHVGRGGWTWYTGSSGWMYKVGLEEILGFKKKGSSLIIDPCIPSYWKEFKIRYKYNKTDYIINVSNPAGVNRGVKEVKMDGVVLGDKTIKLVDDEKFHSVEVVLG